MNLSQLVSSDGIEVSVAGKNIVEKLHSDQTAFAWKELSLKIFDDCTIIINGNSDISSTLKVPSGLEFTSNGMMISSLEFVEDGIQYYYIAGW